MGGYYGTEEQQNQQKKTDRMTDWIMNTPGACLTGRLMSTDDPDRLGWGIIDQHLSEDRIFSFRWMDTENQAKVAEYARRKGGNVYGWDGFFAQSANLVDSIEPILTRPLPDGMLVELVNHDTVTELQVRFVEYGMAPISAAVLCGDNCRAQSLLIRDASGGIAALGFIGMLQNRFSEMANCAWTGTIAADASHRGKGLGKRITSELIAAAIKDYSAESVMGFAASDNVASCAMLQGCGLQPHENRSLAVSLSKERYSR